MTVHKIKVTGPFVVSRAPKLGQPSKKHMGTVSIKVVPPKTGKS